MEPQVRLMCPLPREREDGEEPEELGTGLRAGAYRATGSRLWAGLSPERRIRTGKGQPWAAVAQGSPTRARTPSADHGEHQSFTSFAFGQPDNQG